MPLASRKGRGALPRALKPHPRGAAGGS
ncbi:MAG: hypothetical protein RI973_198, partial [Bacteroidota bacterium]